MTLKYLYSAGIILLGSLVFPSGEAEAGEPFIGEIKAWGGNFCPRGFAAADGQLLPIAGNTALFSLYGTFYGGDGRTTFALPDLRSRAAIHAGQGAGLTPRALGQRLGTETETMTSATMPSHTHRAGMQTRTDAANATRPRRNSFAVTADNSYQTGAASGQFMNSNTIRVDGEGAGQSVDNRQPFVGMTYCVALVGIFPSRN